MRRLLIVFLILTALAGIGWLLLPKEPVTMNITTTIPAQPALPSIQLPTGIFWWIVTIIIAFGGGIVLTRLVPRLLAIPSEIDGEAITVTITKPRIVAFFLLVCAMTVGWNLVFGNISEKDMIQKNGEIKFYADSNGQITVHQGGFIEGESPSELRIVNIHTGSVIKAIKIDDRALWPISWADEAYYKVPLQALPAGTYQFEDTIIDKSFVRITHVPMVTSRALHTAAYYAVFLCLRGVYVFIIYMCTVIAFTKSQNQNPD